MSDATHPRVWATGDGRFVLDGDIRAEVLAYGPADEMPDDLVITTEPDAADPGPAGEDGGKAAGPAANKAAKPSPNK